ncbi:MAG: hypothetical protein ACE5NM_13165 [Sedimentisphaerales bacterium]
MKSYMLLILLTVIVLGLGLTNGFLQRALADEPSGHEHQHNSSFSLFSLVRPLGIATLSFVSATLLTGLFRRKLSRRFLKIHLALSIISVILGFTHGLLVFVLY